MHRREIGFLCGLPFVLRRQFAVIKVVQDGPPMSTAGFWDGRNTSQALIRGMPMLAKPWRLAGEQLARVALRD